MHLLFIKEQMSPTKIFQCTIQLNVNIPSLLKVYSTHFSLNKMDAKQTDECKYVKNAHLTFQRHLYKITCAQWPIAPTKMKQFIQSYFLFFIREIIKPSALHSFK